MVWLNSKGKSLSEILKSYANSKNVQDLLKSQGIDIGNNINLDPSAKNLFSAEDKNRKKLPQKCSDECMPNQYFAKTACKKY